jgi:hypothetical protein
MIIGVAVAAFASIWLVIIAIKKKISNARENRNIEYPQFSTFDSACVMQF